MVPGSTLRYGSSLRKRTLYPRACKSAPSAADARPFPREETTPPVMKINRAMEGQHGESGAHTQAERIGSLKKLRTFWKVSRKTRSKLGRLRHSLCDRVFSRPPCRVGDEALVRRGNAGNWVRWSGCRRLLNRQRSTGYGRFEEGLLVSPMQRQQVQTETSQEE